MRVWYKNSILVAILVTMGLAQGCASRGSNELSGGKFEPDAEDSQRADVVMAALSQVGTPYVYGATKPGAALDCSALTQYAHRAAGLAIPRASMAQRAAAAPVKKQRLEAGDLVFFRTGPGQYHVGVMVDAARFVHASTSGHRVLITHFDTPYWKARYIGAGTYVKP
ncbi:C40 family peptidase [Rhodoferax sp. 4810]|uniref:C40 family peptidase n=1 Tax=Thiospirillum jenense TaxID=1653858 RepID=A0A839HFR2_9GAMM|nr:C40 family peptidase [Thiospirillum jenense]MBB1073490.1 C40 family peptidase [Rhodoferax jenense]MBB1125977.1 C40 family peptidase [Thiospirillum jenense]